MQNIKFDNGILNEVFDFLSIKVSAFKNSLDNHCMLVLDEMSITPSHIFDISKNTYLGTATLPNYLGDKHIATHALVLMLAGISVEANYRLLLYR